MYSNNHYNKRLKGNARALRSNMTKAEACLWKYVLSKRRVRGHQFRRQKPIDRYIADFACLPLKLVIEVDGPIHNDKRVARNDDIRQKRLEELDFRVIRFTNEEVLTDIQGVYERIEETLKELE